MSASPPISTTYDVLPPLYARWMDELLAGPIAPETNATCADCAMCRKGERDLSQSSFFEPGVKCCSYLPRLANFLVGGALLDEPADDVARQGREQLDRRIDARVAVSPLGLLQNPAYMLLYKTAQKSFGRSKALLCPHFVDVDGGRCGVWRHREATCTTYFCKHVRGAVGKEMWSTIQQLLSTVETNLAIWCVTELDIGSAALKTLLGPHSGSERDRIGPEQLDGEMEPEATRALWGNWFGREREFYMECARRVQALSWADVMRLCGPSLAAHARLAREAYEAATSSAVPEHLAMAPVQLVRAKSPSGDPVARVATYSAYDPLIIPERLAGALPRFDGVKKTNEVIFDIVAEERMGVNKALVRKLVDFGVLVPTTPAP